MSESGWIGVDLDGTLAMYDKWRGVDNIGEPIAPMVNLVKQWLREGKTIKIFTARIHGHGLPLIGGGVEDVITPIQAWCEKHIGQRLEITNVKDFGMVALFDDRCVQVITNQGKLVEQVGATGKYEQGRLNEDDEGGLRIAIGSSNGKVVVDFGKQTAWIGLGREEALGLANLLTQHAAAIGN